MSRVEEEAGEQGQQRKQQPQENVSEISHDQEAHVEAVQPANASTEARVDLPMANGRNGAPTETSNVLNSNAKSGKPPDESPESPTSQQAAAKIVRSTDPQLVAPLSFCMDPFKTVPGTQIVLKIYVC